MLRADGEHHRFLDGSASLRRVHWQGAARHSTRLVVRSNDDRLPHRRVAKKEAQPHLPVGSSVNGRYRVEGIIGEGGMGVVYRVRDDLHPDRAARAEDHKKSRYFGCASSHSSRPNFAPWRSSSILTSLLCMTSKPIQGTDELLLHPRLRRREQYLRCHSHSRVEADPRSTRWGRASAGVYSQPTHRSPRSRSPPTCSSTHANIR